MKQLTLVDVVMLLQMVFRKHRKAVSPVVSTLLMIGLSIAAATVVVGVLNNIENRANIVDTDDIGLGSIGTQNAVEPTINVTSIQRDAILELNGTDDYVEIKVDVTNVDSNPLYVFDIDVIVYGQKLDEISQWQITDAEDAFAVVSGGQFGGFRQSSGQTIRYTASLNDISNTQARIPANASFVYEVIFGNEPNLVSGSVAKEKLSEVIFSPIWFRVAIFHYGSSFATNDAATQYEGTMNSLNGTNRIFFNYSRSADAYDYRNNPGSIVGLTVAQEYDVVIVDTWAVPMVISNELSIIHQNQTRLIFYGSLANVAATTADIPTVFNVTATQEITGLTPAPYDGTGSGNIVYSSNSYAFYDTTSSVLAGLAGRTFEELEDNSAGGTGGQNPGICNTETSTGGIGDVFGFDIANMTGPSSNYLSHGVSSYDYDDNNRNPIFSYIGTLMSEKFNNTVFGENETLVYSFVWKHNNSLAPPGADLIDSTQLSQIRINMLSAVLQESNRVFTSDPKVRIDAFSIDIPSNSNKWFDLFVDGTVLENDIINGSMSITIDMPNEYQFQGCVPAQSGDFYINGILKSNSIRVSILTDHIVSIDIGDYSTDTISAGSSFRLELGAINTKLFKIAADETVYNWDVTIETGDYSGVTKTYAYAVDAGADNLAPNQVTGLAVVTASSSQLDLSWDATADNGGGTIAYYEIYRDTVLIDTTVATSYSDTSLTTGTTYTYSVVAVDDSGNAGPASVNVDGTTASGTPPPDVTGFTATAISSSQIDLSWTGIANIDSYNIYRDGALITNEVAGTTSFSDTGLTASTLYSYEIYAVNNTIESVNPGAASATTDPAASTEMYVSAISISYAQSGGGQNPQYTISVTFTVLDGDGNPVSGASVSFAYNAGSNAGSSSGVTGGSGTVTVGLGNGNKIRSGDAVVINVSNITLGGYTYNPALPGAVTNLSDLDGPPSGAST